MSSNYPPGVSGHEYAIAGPDYEQDEERTCGAEDVEFTTLSAADGKRLDVATDAVRKLALLRSPTPDDHELAMEAYRALSAIYSDREDVTLPTCPFNGTVTVNGSGDERWWTCPLCHTSHEYIEVD